MKDRLIELLNGYRPYEFEEFCESEYKGKKVDNRPKDDDGLIVEYYNSKGGYEGSGEEYYIILKVTLGKEESLWKIPGSYYSHDGVYIELGNIHQVEEYEKVVKDYRAL